MQKKKVQKTKAVIIRGLLTWAMLLALLLNVSACDTKGTSESKTADSSTSASSEETSSSQSESKKPEQLKKITFALDWVANTNHSGLFLAKELGYFEEEGLDVELVQSDMNFIEMVASGAAQLGIASQEQVLQARASFAKVPVVSVAAVVQHNTSGFASPKDRNIETAADFADKTYSGWGTDLELAFISHLMEAQKADFSKVKVINMSATNFIQSMETEADFAWIYWGWDGVLAEQENYPINFILLQDVDPNLDFYSPTIITSEELIANDPDTIKAFLRASKKGYDKAIADPSQAVEVLLKEAPEQDKDFLLKSQAYLNEQYVAEAKSWGEMSKDRWTTFYTWMLENELLENEISVEDAYSLEFLP